MAKSRTEYGLIHLEGVENTWTIRWDFWGVVQGGQFVWAFEISAFKSTLHVWSYYFGSQSYSLWEEAAGKNYQTWREWMLTLMRGSRWEMYFTTLKTARLLTTTFLLWRCSFRLSRKEPRLFPTITTDWACLSVNNKKGFLESELLKRASDGAKKAFLICSVYLFVCFFFPTRQKFAKMYL